MLAKKELFNNLLNQVKEIIENQSDRVEKLDDICLLLRDNVMYYDWVGFYLINPLKKTELLLGPFAGAPTEHVKITFGKGICGQAAETKSTIIAQDVSKEINYLSCSPIVKSEIVVPIVKNERFIGELDIDSNDISAFSEDDKEFLEEVCTLLANNLF